MGELGKDIVEGLWNGIKDMTSWIEDKISGFGEDVLDGLKDFFGINSPSRVMRDEVGKFLPQGLAVGIKEKTKDAVNAVKTMGKKVLEPAKRIVSGVNDNLQYNGSIAGVSAASAAATSNVYNFYQTNNSPQALDRLEIYRQTKNLLSTRG